jgi:putative PEP-CTERM system TPR-repeat lipoprotein
MLSKILFPLVSSFFLFSTLAIAQSSDSYERALQSFYQNEINETFIHLKNALKEEPSHLPSKILLAKVHLLRGEGDAAIDYIEEAMTLGADANLTTLTLAKAYLLKRDYLKAISLTDSNLTVQNKFELILLQASALQGIERDDEALIKYKQAIAIQPNNIKALSDITYFYLRIGDTQQVKKYLTQLESIAPESAVYLYITGQLLEGEGKHEEALTYFEKAYDKSPTNSLISRSLANSFIKFRKYTQARIIVNEILKESPDEPFIMLLNARLHTVSKENKLADEAYGELIQKFLLVPSEVMEKMPELLYISGLADYMMSRYESAQQKLQSFITAKPDNLNAIVLLVDIYLKQEQRYKAIELLERNSQLVEGHLPTALKLCNLYLQDKKAFKCNTLLVSLNRVYGNHDGINYLQVKVLQSYKKHAEALVFFEEKLSTSQEIKVKKLAISLYTLNNQHQQALVIVNELLKEDPSNVNLQLTKSDVLIELKQFDTAEPILQNIVKAQPNLLKAKFNQAQILYLKRNYAEAQKQAEKLLENEPNSFRIYTLLGNSLLGQRKFDLALSAFYKARQFSKNNPAAVEPIIKLYRMSGKLDLALTELNSLGKQFFLEPKYIQQKAEIYVLQRKYEQAAREFKILFDLWGENYQLLLVLAQMQRGAKLYQDAEASVVRSLEVKPNFIYSEIELLRIYLIQKQFTKAESLAQKLLKTHPRNANIQLLSGDVDYARNEFKKAHQHYLNALRLNNNYSLAAIKLYKLARTKHIGEQILENTLIAIIAEDNERYLHRNLLADLYLGQDRKDKAKAQYEILEKVDNLPNKQFLYNNLANLYLDEDLIIALAYIEKALTIEQSNASFYDTKGWILCLQENFQEGLNLLRRSYAINSNNPANRYHIAYALNALDRKAEAKIELDAALFSNENFIEIDQAKILRDSLL